MQTVKSARAAKMRQRGISLIQILLAAVVGTALTVAGIRAAQGQKADAEFSAGVQMITSEVPAALASFYEINGRTYSGTPAVTPAAMRTALLSRGVNPNMTWDGPAWTVTTVTPTAVTVSYPCDGALRGAGCTELQNSITRFRAENATFNTATRGITANPAITGTGAAAALTIVYGRQG